MRYWLVTCQRGHCGINRSTDITFAIMAHNLIEATDKARRMPSVKHTRGVLIGREISEAVYIEYRKTSAYERSNQNYHK